MVSSVKRIRSCSFMARNPKFTKWRSQQEREKGFTPAIAYKNTELNQKREQPSWVKIREHKYSPMQNFKCRNLIF